MPGFARDLEDRAAVLTADSFLLGPSRDQPPGAGTSKRTAASAPAELAVRTRSTAWRQSLLPVLTGCPSSWVIA